MEDRTLYVYENGTFKPVNWRRPGRPARYPLADLRVNESFFMDGAKSASTSIYQRASRLGIKVKQKFVREGDAEGVRVWRIE